MIPNFILTKYFYPIRDRITLSKKFNFTLGNPKTSQEIEYVTTFLSNYFDSRSDISFAENYCKQMRSKYSDSDSYLKAFFEQNQASLITLCKMTVIIYFDNDESMEKINKDSVQMLHQNKIIQIVSEDDQFILKRNRLIDFSYLLSLLLNSENPNYHGTTLLLIEPPEFFSEFGNWFGYQLACLNQNNSFNESERISGFDEWKNYGYLRNKVVETTNKIDTLDEKSKAKLMYVSELLRISGYNSDDKTKLIILTSIIELLLTHKPDYNRFNVEDSISKQFQLKAAILVYINNKTIDLNHLKKRLKLIYEQRSNVVHGNFDEFQKKSTKEQNSTFELIGELYYYVRYTVYEYIYNENFVKFLKES
ncbi:hypothetical protein HUU42_02530 [bacterium]|nr:hypothetical protein [bacterium]